MDSRWQQALGRAEARNRPAITVPDFWASQSHSTIRTQHGVVSFEPFPWQVEFVNNMTPREMILKSRDVGSSEICVRWFVWRMMRDGGNLLIKADKWDNARNLVTIARQYLTSLPDTERPKLLRDNETELELAGIGTIKAMAQGGGRSERCRYLLKTERAFWQNAAEEEAAISGALVAGGALIQESTANGFNDWHEQWQNETNGYRKTFVGRNDNPTHDAAWWAQKQAELAAQGRTLQQEYPSTPHEAFVTSGNCLFDTDAIGQYLDQCRPPIETRLNGTLRIWQRPMPSRQYVAGADVAEGLDAGNDRLDYSGIAVYDRQTCAHVADLHGQWPLDEFARLCKEASHLYNDALLGIERNNHGHAVLELLKTEALYYRNLYYHTEGEQLTSRRPAKPRRVAGWPTTRVTKPAMEQELAALITSGGIVSYDQAFWDECRSYVRHGDGSTGGQQGCHDDRCIKHMIALQMRRHVPRASGGVLAGRFAIG